MFASYSYHNRKTRSLSRLFFVISFALFVTFLFILPANPLPWEHPFFLNQALKSQGIHYTLPSSASSSSRNTRVTTRTSPTEGPSCPVQPEPVPHELLNANRIPNVLARSLDQLQAFFDNGYNEFAKVLPELAVSAGVVYDNELIWSSAHGSVHGRPATIDTVYRVGSLSKWITNIMMMKLRDSGKLVLDDPVQKYVPGLKFRSSYKNNPGVTWRGLAGQTSGLAGGTPCDFFTLLEPITNDECDITNEEAWRRVSEQALIAPLYAEPHYADSAFAILGRALESVTGGRKYEQYLQEEIFKPLGMKNTFFDLDWERSAQVPNGYVGNGSIPWFMAHWDLRWARPTGQVYSSVRDLARLASLFLLGKDEPTNEVGIFASSLREMMQPTYLNNDGGTAFGMPFEMTYTGGLGYPTSRYWLRTKGGAMIGYSSVVTMIPELKLAIILQANNMIADDFTAELTQFFLPLFENVLFELAPLPPNPGNLTKYVGEYIASEMLGFINANVTVEADEENHRLRFYSTIGGMGSGGHDTMINNGTLAVWMADNTFRMKDPRTTLTCMWLESGPMDVIFEFQVDNSSGEVVSLTMPQTDPFYGWKFIKKSSSSSWWKRSQS